MTEIRSIPRTETRASIDLRVLPLSAFVFSQTAMQVARRQMRTKEEISDRAGNMKHVGVLEPVLARPIPGKVIGEEMSVEMAAGEGRHLSAKQAGIHELPTIIREMTDEQLEQIQIGENLLRDDVHELVEALGYEMMRKRGKSVDEIHTETGKQKATIYARLKLLALCAEGRTAFLDATVTASVALLIARIPGDEQQMRALKHVAEEHYDGRPMSYRDAARYVHETFMMKLSDAPFQRDDTTLVPNAGACGPCPMRTGNQPELFGDVKGADVCTNPACFQAKKAAHTKRELEKAKATGERVIRGGEAKRILPPTHSYMYSSDGEHKQLRNGFARPRDKCLDDPKKRTYAELAGKDAPTVLLQNPDTGRVEKVFEIEAIADRLKAKGLKPPPKAKNSAEQHEQDNARRKAEEEQELTARRAIFQAVLSTAPPKLGREDLAVLISALFERGYGGDENFYATLGWQAQKANRNLDGRQVFLGHLLKLTDAQLAQLAVAIPVIDVVLENYGKPTELEALAKRFGVDVKKIRSESVVKKTKQQEPTKVAAKAPKKKAAGR